jgi:antitoxin (DNA-binding transcriptional repressor) of toxin-antitoxin stability system
MSREVEVHELPKRINEIIAAIQAGESITYLRNGKSIGTFEPIVPHRGVPFPFRDFDPGPPIPGAAEEALRILREDRDDRRSL